MKILAGIVAMLSWAASPAAWAAPCEDGASAGYACSHIEFAGHLTPAEMGGPGEVLNDIWGWVDPLNGDEYALIGMENGTAFVRIRDDDTLEFLGRLPASDGDSSIDQPVAAAVSKHCHDEMCGGGSSWRDIKVYRNFAYIVSEATGHGVQVFDLTALRGIDGDAPVRFDADANRSYYGYYAGVGHAHNIFVNADTARAYVVGHDNAGLGIAGGLHILDISDPMNPEKIGEVNGDGYTHDVQCVVYKGPDADVPANSEICFASNEDTLTIWDVTGPNARNAVMLARAGYSGVQYAHQGWLSGDQRYFFLNDELDERNTGRRTRTRVFDVSDLDAPEPVADYLAPTLAIDHNNYVHGRWLYQSNYAAGLRILDVLEPEHPVQAAYFDNQPTDNADFYGTWSNYLFPSGRVAFSDINDGLFVVRPTLSTVAATDISLALTLEGASVTGSDPAGGEFVVSNAGTADASDVLVTLHLPAGETLLEVASPSGWACESGAGGRVARCRKEQLAAGSEEEFRFQVATGNAGAMEIIAMAYANEADAAPADNLDSATLTVERAQPPPGNGGGALAWLLPVIMAAGIPARRRSRAAR